MPPGAFLSKDEPDEPQHTINTGISSNEDNPRSIQLTYNVRSARSSNCSFTWEQADSGYIGVMRARDGSTMYKHTFPKVVPEATVMSLGQPTVSKNGDFAIFTFSRKNSGVSLQPYIRN